MRGRWKFMNRAYVERATMLGRPILKEGNIQVNVRLFVYKISNVDGDRYA